MSSRPDAPSGTVVQLMSQIERRAPSGPAVEDASRTLSIGELREQSTRLANALVGLGLQPGERVAYVAQNHLEYVILEFALLKAGLVKVPLNFRLTPSELRWCMELADVRLVVADPGAATGLDEVLSQGDVLQVVIGRRSGWLSFEDLVVGGSTIRTQAPTGPGDDYHVRFSSGSTGRPKGIVISHAGARAAMLGNTWVMSSSAPVAAPRTLQVAPLVYAGGWSVIPTLLCGGTNVVLERFEADETLRAISERGIDWMFAVPTMLRRMSTSPELASLRTSKLSCLMLAGEPAALPALEAVAEHTDAMIQCWGQTEAPASTTLLSRAEMRRPELWGSIGRPVPGVEFSVLVDGVVLDELEPGREGELVIRTPSVTTGLLGAEAERESRLLEGGWWRTSDLGHLDDLGRLFIVGRASETIITGGTNISPVEIERALEELGLVQEAVVVGVPDEQWGETPAALVHVPGLATGADGGAEITAWLRERLPGFKRPRHVFVSARPIPRASGEAKVARGQLKQLLQEWVREPAQLPDDVTKVGQENG